MITLQLTEAEADVMYDALQELRNMEDDDKTIQLVDSVSDKLYKANANA